MYVLQMVVLKETMTGRMIWESMVEKLLEVPAFCKPELSLSLY